MRNIKFYSYTLGCSLILSACGSVETATEIKKNSGYFVSSFNERIDYTCLNERRTMTDNGKFECDSFPISFYMDEVKIGEISSIHSDGYVYPQDIILLEDTVPIYTSEGKIKFLEIE
ncbi:MAG: Unknown protein [uncultured Sulfurovum sp.]|uniref:Lipoprotein n=1 Tax=uncultured Sulfurovum sp. TaxID=269237 RepID=A0A6S6S7X6_9BACT|nr:MAG: Unknown protein [uncultured Sulfurovum sp.]